MSGIDRPTPRMQVVDHGVEQGISWVTCRAPLYGAVNGYVKIPEGHHWHGLDYDSFGVDVHGGLTYGGGPSGWVGFDCLHSGDVWPEGPSWDRGKPWSKNWTAELVAEETRRLARNIAAGHVEPTQLDWLAQAAAELSGAAAHVADDEWPVGEVQGTLLALQWDHMTTGPQWPVVLLCERCGRPFQTDVIRALCGACQRAQEVAG